MIFSNVDSKTSEVSKTSKVWSCIIKHLIYFIVFIAFYNSLQAQSITIAVNEVSTDTAFLSSLQGENIFTIDTIISINNNKFQFELSTNTPGFYRLTFHNSKGLNFIYENEEVEIETDINNIVDSLKVIKSESNKIYYEFVKLNKDYKNKTELLSLILARYPNEDDFYQTTKDKLIQIQEEYLYFVNVRSQENPNSFIARYVRSAQLPVVDIEIPIDKQLDFLKSHSLDFVNFNDDELIYSDAFANKSIEYLTYYRNPQLPMGLLEQEFMKAIDSILSKANVNEIVYKHIVEYLLDGFKKFGFDNVINYIVENYVIKDDICLDESLSTALERRIQQVKNFKIGNVVPDIVMQNEEGKEIQLSTIGADKILLVFYSTDCPHCNSLLPELYKLYKEQKNKTFEVVAISLDENRDKWQEYIKTNGYNWINLNDKKGWSSKFAEDYYIYATPTMFLVDMDRKLILMPKNVEDIKNQML